MDITELKLRMLSADSIRLADLSSMDEVGSVYRGIQKLSQPNRGDIMPLDLGVVYYLLNGIDKSFEKIYPNIEKHSLIHTNDALKVWSDTPRVYRNRFPKAGDIAVWQYYLHGKPTISGHIGIIATIDRAHNAKVLEGFVPNGFDNIKRKEQGIFLNERKLISSDKMKILGYISPWKEL